MALIIFLNLFFVGLLVGIGLAYRTVQREDRAFSSCLAKVWQSQNEHKKLLEKLLDLNPKVARLRAAKLKAEMRLAAALSSGNPVAIASAEATLDVINAQMLVLDGQQKILLSEAAMVSHEFNLGVVPAVKRSSAEKITVDDLRLAVRAEPPHEIAPFYVLDEPFAVNQQAGATWSLKNLRGECHATLENRRGQWFVRMIGDKS